MVLQKSRLLWGAVFLHDSIDALNECALLQRWKPSKSWRNQMLVSLDLLGILMPARVVLQLESENILDRKDSVFDFVVGQKRSAIVDWRRSECVDSTLAHKPPNALEPLGDFVHSLQAWPFLLCDLHGRIGSSSRMILSF